MPDGYTIDQLLEAREQDLLFSQQLETVTTTEDEGEGAEPPGEVEGLVGNVPLGVFQLIDDRDCVVFCAKLLKEWQWRACQIHPEVVMPSWVFFSLVQQLILTPTDEVGRAVVRCAECLGKKSIEYRLWYGFVKEGMHTAVPSAVFLLAISDFDMFLFENEEMEKNARVAVVLLHAAAMLCPLISEHSAFGGALKALRNNLKREDLFSDADIKKIVDVVTTICVDVPVKNLHQFLSLFPLDGVGKRIMYSALIRVCFLLIGMESVPDDPTIEDLVSIIGFVKNMCDRPIQCDVNKASVVIAMTEKIVVAGLLLSRMTRSSLDEICKRLRFPIGNGAEGTHIFLKEQLHVTRCQLENLLQTLSE